MLAADQLPRRKNSLRSVDAAASNVSLSTRPRTTKHRSRSRSAAPDTRRTPSNTEDVNVLMSDENFASFSSLQSLSAGHSPLNSPDFNLPQNVRPSSPFLFSTPIQRRPSSAEPTVFQPEPQHSRGRHQTPGPSKVSIRCHMIWAPFPLRFPSQPTCACRFRCRGVLVAFPVVLWGLFPQTLPEVLPLQ